MKTVKIGKTYYELKKLQSTPTYRQASLYECYVKPSQAKQQIYDEWYERLSNDFEKVRFYGIESYNCMMITLSAEVVDQFGNKYRAYITPSHNYLYDLHEIETTLKSL